MSSQWLQVPEALRIYNEPLRAQRLLQALQGRRPKVAIVLGFTQTGLLPGISAAGATPSDRQWTALADAEFLYRGPGPVHFPLPPLQAGASPTLISRAIVAGLNLPLHLFDAGLPHPLPVPHAPLHGQVAACVSSGAALPRAVVEHLWKQGWRQGNQLMHSAPEDYLVIGECVVGGTTTALAVLLGLGIDAAGKVNSSHPNCNHAQKLTIARTGLAKLTTAYEPVAKDPVAIVAAVGDPMQPVVTGMAMAASLHGKVLLAGGTQMLAVYALMRAWGQKRNITWKPHHVAVGTTRWVAEDPTGDTIGLAQQVDAPLIATQLSFHKSKYWQLQAYEKGFVKEGVGAGGCAISAYLYASWKQPQLLAAIEATLMAHSRAFPR